MFLPDPDPDPDPDGKLMPGVNRLLHSVTLDDTFKRCHVDFCHKQTKHMFTFSFPDCFQV